MKLPNNILICVVVALFSVPLIRAQDLSKYRQFSLGTSLADVSKQIDQRRDSETIQQSPDTIQRLEWRPVALNIFTRPESVQGVIFSFYNHTLYKIDATYDHDATAGLTGSDMIRAISVSYGPSTHAIAETSSHSDLSYRAVGPPLAQWEDAQYSVTLSRELFLGAFRLVVLTKQVNAQAEASVIEAAKQEKTDAPQKEIARVKKAAADLETQRQANSKAFRP